MRVFSSALTRSDYETNCPQLRTSLSSFVGGATRCLKCGGVECGGGVYIPFERLTAAIIIPRGRNCCTKSSVLGFALAFFFLFAAASAPLWKLPTYGLFFGKRGKQSCPPPFSSSRRVLFMALPLPEILKRQCRTNLLFSSVRVIPIYFSQASVSY
jgi:hypothetical protein